MKRVYIGWVYFLKPVIRENSKKQIKSVIPVFYSLIRYFMINVQELWFHISKTVLILLYFHLKTLRASLRSKEEDGSRHLTANLRPQAYFKYDPILCSWVTHFPLLNFTLQNYKMREFKHNVCYQIYCLKPCFKIEIHSVISNFLVATLQKRWKETDVIHFNDIFYFTQHI